MYLAYKKDVAGSHRRSFGTGDIMDKQYYSLTTAAISFGCNQIIVNTPAMA